MTIRARFSANTEDAVPTIQWLVKSGSAQVDSGQQVYDLGIVEIQLHETPSVLAYLSHVEDSLSISRITSEGVVFYLTDVPLWLGVDGKQRVSADHPDGFLFVPMCNVVCVNTFGSIYAHQPKG